MTELVRKPASANNSGELDKDNAQTIAGDKTFTGSVEASGSLDVTGDFSAINEYGDQRNFMINGNFDFWQRGTGASNFTNIGNGDYRADRWVGWENLGTAVITCERDGTDVPTQAQSGFASSYCSLLTVATPQASVGGSEAAVYQQLIEGYNFAAFKGKTITLSFWVKGSVAGTYCLTFRNTDYSRVYITEYTIDTADTWEKKTITITWNPVGGSDNFENGIGARITWVLAAGTSIHGTPDSWLSSGLATSNQTNFAATGGATLRIAQVMLNVGPKAAPFQRAGRNIQDELAMCHRYYQQLNGTTFSAIGTCIRYNNSSVIADYPLSVPLRDFPSSVTFTGSFEAILGGSLFDVTVSSLNRQTLSDVSMSGRLSISGNPAAGHGGILLAGKGSTVWSIETNAEL